MAESRAERKARRVLIEAAEGSEEKKSSQKSKSSQDAKGKSAKSKAKAKRPSSRRSGDKASQTRPKRSHKDPISSTRKVADPKSPCSIMKSCGGCTALNRPYKKQLAAKQARVADLLGAPVDRPVQKETTVLGAAYLAGLECGFFPPPDVFAGQWRLERRFTPQMLPEVRAGRIAQWRDAVGRLIGGV